MAVNYQKVWRTMNDLEMVTSKICSAREIIDAAVDRIQEHQHDKAEAMMSAAYEFLEYYLQEFDDKFKLAWQATVGDLRDGDVSTFSCDNDDPSPECRGAWNSFWSDHDGSTVSSVQYTEEELNAMCDEVEKKNLTYDESITAGYEMTADRFWIPPQKEDKVTKWQLPVEMHPSGEYYVLFPDDLLEAANLKESDQVEWVDNGNGSYTLRKVADD
jgi:hypothetical protein